MTVHEKLKELILKTIKEINSNENQSYVIEDNLNIIHMQPWTFILSINYTCYSN